LPTRQDLQRVIEWCDTEPPFQWLRGVAGVVLAVHSVTPIGTPSPSATALWTGDLALREMHGISELPDEPVHFVGSLVGVRNPARRSELRITADAQRTVAKLSGDAIPAAWSAGLEIEHIRDDRGLLSADWTFGLGGEPPEGFDFPQVFELLIWPSLRTSIDLGRP
jgi:hypothetical protein